MDLNEIPMEKLVGTMCLHKARCEAHAADQEPGQAWISLIAIGYTLFDELHRRCSPKDWEWYKWFFREIGVASSTTN